MAVSMKVLQNYIEEDSCLAKRRLKKNREQNQKLNRAEKTRLDIEEKLYVEFFTEIYSEYYRADYKWNKVVDCVAWLFPYLTATAL